MKIESPLYVHYMHAKRLAVISFVLLMSQLLTACSIPNSKPTLVSITGRLLDRTGRPLSGRTLEVGLPAEYGMQEIDKDYSSPEALGHKPQQTLVLTDSMGSFSHTFKDLKYHTALWILPPLGNFPRQPPQPKLTLRVLEIPDVVYSISMVDTGVVYGVWRGARNKRKYPKPPYVLDGELIGDIRDETQAWIADITLRETYK